jgi:hypothetical protein
MSTDAILAQVEAYHLRKEADLAYEHIIEIIEERIALETLLTEQIEIQTEALDALNVASESQAGHDRARNAEFERARALYNNITNSVNEMRKTLRDLIIDEQENIRAIRNSIQAEESARQSHVANLINDFIRIKNEYGEFSEEAVAAFQATIEAGAEWSDSTIRNMARGSDAARDAERVHGEALSLIGGHFESTSNQATNAFKAMTNDTSVSFEEMMANLRHNEEMTREWGNNTAEAIRIATEEMGGAFDENVERTLREIADRGPGYAEMLAGKSGEELVALVEAYEGASQASMDKMVAIYGDHAPVIEATTELGHSAMAGYAKGIRDRIIDAQLAAERAALDTQERFRHTNDSHSPATVYIKFGEDVVDGYAKGIRDNAHRAVTAARDMATSVQREVQRVNQSRSPARAFAFFGLDAMDGYVLGLEEGSEDAVLTINEIMHNMQDVVEENSDLKEFGIAMIESIQYGAIESSHQLIAALSQIGAEISRQAEIISYDPDINYWALIQEAIAAGDLLEAARLEQLRNAKIIGEGLEDQWDQTFEFKHLLPDFESTYESMMEIWGEAPEWFDQSVLMPIGEEFKELNTFLVETTDHTYYDTIGIWEPFSDWFSDNVVVPIKSMVTSLSEHIISQMMSAIASIEAAISAMQRLKAMSGGSMGLAPASSGMQPIAPVMAFAAPITPFSDLQVPIMPMSGIVPASTSNALAEKGRIMGGGEPSSDETRDTANNNDITNMIAQTNKLMNKLIEAVESGQEISLDGITFGRVARDALATADKRGGARVQQRSFA